MNNLDCRSIVGLKADEVDFLELSTLIKAVREQIDSYRKKQSPSGLSKLEISERLITPLQNLDELYTTLFTENEQRLNETQRKYLEICELYVARFYCYIHHFIELKNSETQNIAVDEVKGHAQNLNYEFYYYAHYELLTPANIIRGYSEAKILGDMKVDVSPFMPENQEKFDKIRHWVEELLKFINDLPEIWKAYAPKDAG